MKKLFVAAALLLLVLAGALGWAALNLDRYLDENRGLIETKVSEAVGRSVRFDKLSLSFRGGLAVRIDNVVISDDPAYSENPFVTAKSALGKVRILPALRGEFDVVRVSLVEPQVTLIRDSAGFNVSSIAETPDAPATESPPTTAPIGGGTAAVAVALFDIEGGTLNFIDRLADPDFETVWREIEFHASDLSATTPVRIELSASVLDSEESNLSLAGTVGPIVASSPDRSPVELELRLDPVDGAAAVRFGQIFGAPKELALQGPMLLRATITGTGADPKVNLHADAGKAQIRYGDTFNKPAGTTFSFDCEAHSDGETARLPTWSFRLGKTVFQGTAESRLDDSGKFHATVRSAPSEIAPLVTMAGALNDAQIGGTFAVDLAISGDKNSPRTVVEGETVLARISVAMAGTPAIHDYSTRMLISSDSLVLEPAEIGIGQSKARVDATIRAFAAPRVTFSLESATLALADLEAASPSDSRTEELRGLTIDGVAEQRGNGDGSMSFRGNLKAKSGVVRNTEFDTLSASVRYADGRATLDPLTLNAYGGALAGKGSYEQRENAQPSFSVDLRADHIDAAKLIDARTAGGSLISGSIDGQLAAVGRGDAWESIRSTLDGSGSFAVSGGKIRDVNLAEEVLQGITGLPGLSSLLSPNLQRKHPGLFSTGDTAFRDLSTTFKLTGGRMLTDDLNLAAADYGIRGAGSMGLDGSLDLNATFRASESLTSSLVSEIGAVKYLSGPSGRLEIPFRLGGTLPAVRAEPDMRMLTKALEGALVGGLVDQFFGGAKSPIPSPGKKSPVQSGDEPEKSDKKQKKKR